MAPINWIKVYNVGMTNITLNPKLIALGQTLFYGAITAALPVLIGMITNGGIIIPYGLTGVVLLVLNYIENSIQANTGKALFGAIG
ncbi:MAG: hypothetical protein ACYC3F_17230 [Gemmatimonadaceae bacterium]